MPKTKTKTKAAADPRDCGLDHKKAEALRARARAEYADEGRIEIDENAQISAADSEDEPEGCYIQAWVWVEYDDAEED